MTPHICHDRLHHSRHLAVLLYKYFSFRSQIPKLLCCILKVVVVCVLASLAMSQVFARPQSDSPLTAGQAENPGRTWMQCLEFCA